MFSGEDVVEVTLISCPRTLECMNPFLHMILIDSRSDFRCKKYFLNYRCHNVEIIYFPYLLSITESKLEEPLLKPVIQVDKQKNPFYYTNRHIGGVACYIRLTWFITLYLFFHVNWKAFPCCFFSNL